MSMQTIRLAVGTALVGLLGSAALMAQAPNPPSSTSNPSAASSPSQRETTHNPSSEAAPTPGDNPSDASTPHQREAMASNDKAMKKCMDKQAKATPEATKSEMTQACNEQMKAEKERLSKAHPAPKDSSTTPAPR